jgi:glycosyltransferase involved in cell wall biosynthesis
MRWLVLTDGISPFEIGGMQKHSYNLTRQLLINGESVTLLHCVTKSKNLPTKVEVAASLDCSDAAIQGLDVKAFRFPDKGKMPGHYIRESYLLSCQYFDFVKADLDQFDVVFAQGFTAWKFIEEKKKNQSITVPIINHFHGLEMFQRTYGWRSAIQKWMLQGVAKWNISYADATISLGGKIDDILLSIGILPAKILTISSGVDENWFVQNMASKGETPKILFVGRFERRKGLSELIKAYKWVLKNKKEIQLSIVGPIPHHMRDFQSGLEYFGEIKDETQMKRIMDEHHILVVPSIAEGMPTVILEAMSRGLAIICTDVGANRVMVNEENGWLISKVSIAEIAEQLQNVLDLNQVKLNEMGLKSLNKVKDNWGWTKVGLDHINAVRNFVAKRK